MLKKSLTQILSALLLSALTYAAEPQSPELPDDTKKEILELLPMQKQQLFIFLSKTNSWKDPVWDLRERQYAKFSFESLPRSLNYEPRELSGHELIDLLKNPKLYEDRNKQYEEDVTKTICRWENTITQLTHYLKSASNAERKIALDLDGIQYLSNGSISKTLIERLDEFKKFINKVRLHEFNPSVASIPQFILDKVEELRCSYSKDINFEELGSKLINLKELSFYNINVCFTFSHKPKSLDSVLQKLQQLPTNKIKLNASFLLTLSQVQSLIPHAHLFNSLQLNVYKPYTGEEEKVLFPEETVEEDDYDSVDEEISEEARALLEEKSRKMLAARELFCNQAFEAFAQSPLAAKVTFLRIQQFLNLAAPSFEGFLNLRELRIEGFVRELHSFSSLENLSTLYLNTARLSDLPSLHMLKKLELIDIKPNSDEYQGPSAENLLDVLSQLNNPRDLYIKGLPLTQEQVISLSQKLDLTTISAKGNKYLGGKVLEDNPIAYQQATSSSSSL